MTDIFQEVDQSLREESVASLWKRWQWVVYGLIGAAVLGVGGFEIWRGMRDNEINKSAVIYDAGFAARENNDLTAARNSFAQLETDQTGFKALSGHMLAGVEKDLTNDMAAVEAHLGDVGEEDRRVNVGALVPELPLEQIAEDLRLEIRTGIRALDRASATAVGDRPIDDVPGEHARVALDLDEEQALAREEQQIDFVEPTR